MDGLTTGLTIGLAFAGAAGGYIAHIFDGLGKMWGGGSVISPGKSALVGTFIGAALGFGVGTGIDMINGDATTPSSEISSGAAAAECVAATPEGKKAVITKDALGNPVCSFE